MDRSLDSSRFRALTGFVPPSWPDMIGEMASDATPYEQWRGTSRGDAVSAGRTPQDVCQQDASDHRRDGHVRQRRPQPVPRYRHRRDPRLQPRREEAGRHAAPLHQSEAEVLHRRRPRLRQHRVGARRRGLRVPRRGAEAGAVLRVLSAGGIAHQRARGRKRAEGLDGQRRRAGDRALHRQVGLSDQRDGDVEGDDGEADGRARRAWRGRTGRFSAARGTAT